MSDRRPGRGDLLALLTLVGTAVVVAWPILRGGWLTYIDNAVHIAEVLDLSRPESRGWSEIGFTGFPLGTLHSPIWYPALARLVRAGVPLPPVYATLLLVGYLSPPLAIYAVARRRTTPVRASLLAYLTMIQPAMVWGIGSPLGGMWTHAIAVGCVMLLVDLLARPELSPGQHLWASALLSFAGLTHLFVLPIVTIVAVLSTLAHAVSRTLTLRELGRRVAGWTVAATASAAYWLGQVHGGGVRAGLGTFRPIDALCRVVLSADPMYLQSARLEEGLRWDLHMTEAGPTALVLSLGIAAAVLPATRRDPLVRVGSWLSVSVAALVVAHHWVELRFLGPVSWRLLDWVRTGFTFAAMPLVVRLRLPSPAGVAGIAATLAGVLGAPLSGWWWGLPLRLDSPDSTARAAANIEPLWDWLRENKSPDWGRVYLQDTFGWLWKQGGLAQSHLLVLTAHHTGVRQLGTYYGVVPYGLKWTLSEFNSLYDVRNPSREWLVEAMDKTNAGVLVTSSDDVTTTVRRTEAFDELWSHYPFTVWRRRDATNHPIAELSPSNQVLNVELGEGDFRFRLVTEYPRARVLIRTGYHPDFRVEGVPLARLRESPEGFLVLDEVPEGEFDVHVWYEPTGVPRLISLVGGALLLAWGAALVARRRRTAGAPTAA